MPKLKLTKTVVVDAQPDSDPYEIRDTTVPGFLLKVTPAGRKIFIVAYVANNGQRRKPAIGRFGEITVEQARNIAQDWLADVRKGKDPSAEKSAARQALTVKDLFDRSSLTIPSRGTSRPPSSPTAVTASSTSSPNSARSKCRTSPAPTSRI